MCAVPCEDLVEVLLLADSPTIGRMSLSVYLFVACDLARGLDGGNVIDDADDHDAEEEEEEAAREATRDVAHV